MELVSTYVSKRIYKADLQKIEAMIQVYLQKDQLRHAHMIEKNRTVHGCYSPNVQNFNRGYATALSDVLSMMYGENRNESKKRVSYYYDK